MATDKIFDCSFFIENYVYKYILSCNLKQSVFGAIIVKANTGR